MSHKFGGPAILLDRDDINTDEIIPAKYLTEITKLALKPHLLEDLKLEGFNPQSTRLKEANVVITRANFGCGSSREHAVWAFEVNSINVVIASSFARIFRQNMFNCGILAIELPVKDIESIFQYSKNRDGIKITFNEALTECIIVVVTALGETVEMLSPFTVSFNDYDRSLVSAGGWLAYADQNY